MDEVISGNPELLSADQLHESAWKSVLPHFQKAQDEALAKYHQLAGVKPDMVPGETPAGGRLPLLIRRKDSASVRASDAFAMPTPADVHLSRSSR
jgi:hypothetical protein